MGNAKRDDNNNTTLLGISSIDGQTVVPIKVNPITGRLLIEVTGTSGGFEGVYDGGNSSSSIFEELEGGNSNSIFTGFVDGGDSTNLYL